MTVDDAFEEEKHSFIEEIDTAAQAQGLCLQTNEEFYDTLIHLPEYISKQVLLRLGQRGNALLKFLHERNRVDFIDCIVKNDISISKVSKYTFQFHEVLEKLPFGDKENFVFSNIRSYEFGRDAINGCTCDEEIYQMMLKVLWQIIPQNDCKSDDFKEIANLMKKITSMSCTESLSGEDYAVCVKFSCILLSSYYHSLCYSFDRIVEMRKEVSWEVHCTLESLLKMPVIDKFYEAYCKDCEKKEEEHKSKVLPAENVSSAAPSLPLEEKLAQDDSNRDVKDREFNIPDDFFTNPYYINSQKSCSNCRTILEKYENVAAIKKLMNYVAYQKKLIKTDLHTQELFVLALTRRSCEPKMEYDKITLEKVEHATAAVSIIFSKLCNIANVSNLNQLFINPNNKDENSNWRSINWDENHVFENNLSSYIDKLFRGNKS